MYTSSVMVRVLTKGPEDQGSILGRVIPKTQKMVLDTVGGLNIVVSLLGSFGGSF